MGFSFNTLQSDYSDYSNEYISVKTAAKISGYSRQYLRRLLRDRTFQSKRIGQLWLIDLIDFRNYLKEAIRSTDKRFGPHSGPPII